MVAGRAEQNEIEAAEVFAAQALRVNEERLGHPVVSFLEGAGELSRRTPGAHMRAPRPCRNSCPALLTNSQDPARTSRRGRVAQGGRGAGVLPANCTSGPVVGCSNSTAGGSPGVGQRLRRNGWERARHRVSQPPAFCPSCQRYLTSPRA